jgi:hypothetical protein
LKLPGALSDRWSLIQPVSVSPFTRYHPPTVPEWPRTVMVAPLAAVPTTLAERDGPTRMLRPTGLSTVRGPLV